MPPVFQTLKASFADVETAVAKAVSELNELEATGVSNRAAVEEIAKRLSEAAAELDKLRPIREKQGAKAALPKEKRLINEATAVTITEFCSKFDAFSADLTSVVIPKADAAVAAAPAPPPEAEPEAKPMPSPEQKRARTTGTQSADSSAPAAVPSSVSESPSAESKNTSSQSVAPMVEDPELAAAIALSMQETASTEAPPVPTEIVNTGAPAATAKVQATKVAKPASPGVATTVRTRLIQSGAEMELAVPEGVDALRTRNFRELVAAVYGLGDPASITLIAGGKQLRDDQTLADGGVTADSLVFVGVNPSGASPPPAAAAAPTVSTPTSQTPAASASSDGEVHGKAAVVQAMVTAITTMKESSDYVALIAGVRTVVKLMDNLVKHPDDPKYSKVKMSNVLLKKRLLSKAGGVACLEAVGFKKDGDSDFMICEKPSPHIAEVKAMLDEALSRWESD